MTIAAVAGVEPHEAGLASGLINTVQQIGGALGLAILAAIANSRTRLAGRGRQLAAGRADRGLPDRADGRRRLRGPRRGPRAAARRRPRGRGRDATASWCRSRRSQVGAPDRDLQRARLDPERELGRVEARCRRRREPPPRARRRRGVSDQAGGVPAERAEAGVLPVVPQRPVGPLRTLLRCASPCSGRIGERSAPSVACSSSMRSSSSVAVVRRSIASSAASRPAAPRPRSRRGAPAASRGSRAAPRGSRAAPRRRRPGRPARRAPRT